MLFGSFYGVAADGQAQRLPAEQTDSGGSGLPTQSGIQPQQRTDHRGLLVAAPADFGQCVRGAAAARHFHFGQVQLRDPLIDEVDEPVHPVGWKSHPPDPTAPIAISGTRFPAPNCVTPHG